MNSGLAQQSLAKVQKQDKKKVPSKPQSEQPPPQPLSDRKKPGPQPQLKKAAVSSQQSQVSNEYQNKVHYLLSKLND